MARVKGEYRTSIIVEPKDGKMPFTQAGLDLANRVRIRNEVRFDHPEERPLSERCMESLGYAPIRALPIYHRHQIFQTSEYVVIVSEGPVGLRTIRLTGEPPSQVLRSVQGYASGHWEW